MSNTIKQTGPVITISGIDSNWDLGAARPIHSIRFNPAAAGDILILRNGGATEAKIFRAKTTEDMFEAIQYYDGLLLRLFLNVSECTLNANAEVTIILDRSRS